MGKSISDDMWGFIKANDIKSGHVEFLNLVESRITNNLLLLNNPGLCSRLNLKPEDLYGELEKLISIRDKVSFGNKENKKIR